MNTIGRYELVEKLGQGGMGVVHRAFDPLLQRVVAVKLIGTLEANDELRERFFREARSAGQLSHKNVITIYDLGEHEGQPFIAMEFLEGEDLQHRMAAHSKMSLTRKLELSVEICEGIEYAHLHGVIHRDIKPANIFITGTGGIKILDFGLARLITSELTNSNMMMGTLNYMAPEQVRGERADHRSDIFSTGVVLYELLGGRKAFEGESFAATLYKILQEVPEPLHNLDANLPPELVAVVERALEKERDARYQQMSDMLRDLTLYRQQLMLMNSPTFGRPATDFIRVPSDVPHRSPITPRPMGAPTIGSEAPTMAGGTPSIPVVTPLPPTVPASGSSPAPAPPQPLAAVQAPQRRTALVASLAAIVILGALLIWVLTRDRAPAPQTAVTKSDAPADTTQQDIANRLEQASRALQAGDEIAAQRHADAVLSISPGHAEARRLRDRAVQATETVTRNLATARSLFASGRYDEASRAAGEVLAVDPDNAEARRLMDEGAARSRGKGAEEARARTVRARNAAAAAGASKLAGAAYTAAAAAEADASSLYKRGRLAEAMAKFWEASGLFRSAEIAAQTEAAARTERTRIAQAERKPAEPARETAPPPAAPLAPSTTLPPPSLTPPVPPAVPAPASPPQQAPPPPETAAQPASPTSGINEVLDRYEAALESRSLESLKRLWPSLGGAQQAAIRDEFQNTTRIEVEIGSPQINVTGTTATVSFLRTYQLYTVDGQRPRSQSRATMNLRRSGTTWVIDQIRFELLK